MIRRLRPDDAAIPAVLDLIHDAFAHVPGSPALRLTPDSLAARIAEGPALVIERDGAPVACVLARPSRDVPGALYFGTLSVAASARRQGLAHRLVAELDDIARRDGYVGVTLETWSGHDHLIRLYDAMGFSLSDGAEDTVLMTRPFGTTKPRRLSPVDDPDALLALIRDSFAYMEGRIDPPSSMTRLTADSIRDHLTTGEIWIIGPASAPEACIFLSPDPPALYLGKLAVAASARRKGHGRRLVTHAEARARAAGFDRLTLQSRIELTENHTTFRHLGFTKIAVTAHPGYSRPTSITFEKRL